MRRPLCAALAVFLAVYLAISLGMDREGKTDWEDWSEKTVQLTGSAGDLYEPMDGSQDNRTFSLYNITLLSDTGSSLEGSTFPSDDRSELFPKKTTVLCKLNKEEKLPCVGSLVKVSGRVQPFLKATNPGEFDAAAYYEGQGVLFSLTDVVILAQSKQYDRTQQLLYEVRHGTAVLLQRILGEENGPVASAMLLGIKKDMDADLKSLYQDAGIAHVLAISGLHLSFLGMTLYEVLKRLRLPLWMSALISALLLSLYGTMTGFSVSTKRAYVMFLLLLGAQLVKRTPDTLTSLAIAAAVILLKNPRMLKDSGFALSFAAVAGAALMVPVLRDKGIHMQHGPEHRWEAQWAAVEKGLLSGLGITLFTLPLLLTYFYTWNPWSMLANLIVIPLMSVLLIWLLVLAAAGWLIGNLPGGMPVLEILALPAQGIFSLYRKICELALWLPGSRLYGGVPSAVQLSLFFAGLLLLLWQGKRLPQRIRLPAAAALTFIFLIRLPGKLQITMLDVGQGECVCVETPKHHVYLLDAGSSSRKSAGQYQIIPFLEYSGVKRLDGIFVTHWDADHVNALGEILEWAGRGHVKVGKLFLPDTELKDEALSELLALAERWKTEVEYIRAGQRLQEGEVVLECLHPYEGERAADRNGVSLALKISYGGFSGLFTGDLEQEGEDWLVKHYGKEILDCDLLDAGHHGSAGASAKEFLEAVSPKAVLISCGKNNGYGHPAMETLLRIEECGARYYVTARDGAVTVTVGKEEMKIDLR